VRRGALSCVAVLGILEIVQAWDSAAMAFGEGVRCEPLTAFFVVTSAWWVKWPLFALVGGFCDACERRRLPCAMSAALCAAASAGLVVTLVKEAVDRARPAVANHWLDPIGAIPDSASFPSGHSATAFATAVAVGLVYPRLRVPLLALAALVALSRVYLGMHYATDVLVGSALGAAMGLAAGSLVLRVAGRPTERGPRPATP
jgi:membrane-associated phospholipid phosphatase